MNVGFSVFVGAPWYLTDGSEKMSLHLPCKVLRLWTRGYANVLRVCRLSSGFLGSDCVDVLSLLGVVCSGRKAMEHPDGRIIFTQSASVAAASLVVLAYFLFISIHQILFVSLWGLLVISVAAELPGSIAISNDGLEQIFWFRRNKRICWVDIVEINTGKKDRDVTIVSSDGTKIVHGSGLTDRPRLLRELKVHCGANLPEEFPAA